MDTLSRIDSFVKVGSDQNPPKRPKAPGVDDAGIPPELAAIPRWVAWKYTRRSKAEKPAKSPISPRTGRAVSARKWFNLSELDVALGAMRKRKASGVGIALEKRLGIVCVDFDNCLDRNGRMNRSVKKLLRGCHSYAEISPSGKGIHVFVQGRVPFDGRRTK